MSKESTEVIIWTVLLKDIGLIVLGAIIGFLGTEISAWRRRRKDEKEKAIDIIADAVKFITKANGLASDLISQMRHFNSRIFNAPSLDAKKAAEEQAVYLSKAREEATIFLRN